MVIVVALILAVLMAALNPGQRFIVHLLFFTFFTLPLCLILWSLGGFAFFYYVVNTIVGVTFDLVMIFYGIALGVVS